MVLRGIVESIVLNKHKQLILISFAMIIILRLEVFHAILPNTRRHTHTPTHTHAHTNFLPQHRPRPIMGDGVEAY